MPRFIDLTGRTFSRLTVLRRVLVANNRPHWQCQCSCGAETNVGSHSLTSGNTKSCGCLGRETKGDNRRTHGRSGTTEYRTWCHLVERCENPHSRDFKYYGARGITVCPRWRNSFADFYADMGPRPEGKRSIDRIDNNGSYDPSNCRWATHSEQMKNRRPETYVRRHTLSTPRLRSGW